MSDYKKDKERIRAAGKALAMGVGMGATAGLGNKGLAYTRAIFDGRTAQEILAEQNAALADAEQNYSGPYNVGKIAGGIAPLAAGPMALARYGVGPVVGNAVTGAAYSGLDESQRPGSTAGSVAGATGVGGALGGLVGTLAPRNVPTVGKLSPQRSPYGRPLSDIDGPQDTFNLLSNRSPTQREIAAWEQLQGKNNLAGNWDKYQRAGRVTNTSPEVLALGDRDKEILWNRTHPRSSPTDETLMARENLYGQPGLPSNMDITKEEAAKLANWKQQQNLKNMIPGYSWVENKLLDRELAARRMRIREDNLAADSRLATLQNQPSTLSKLDGSTPTFPPTADPEVQAWIEEHSRMSNKYYRQEMADQLRAERLSKSPGMQVTPGEEIYYPKNPFGTTDEALANEALPKNYATEVPMESYNFGARRSGINELMAPVQSTGRPVSLDGITVNGEFDLNDLPKAIGDRIRKILDGK